MKKQTLLAIFIMVLALIGGLVYSTSHHPTAQNTRQPVAQNQKSPTNQYKAAAQSFNKSLYSLDDPNSLWVIVNKKRPLSPKTYIPDDLTNINGGQLLRTVAAQAYMQLVLAAQQAGYTLVAESGYRSFDTQVAVYNKEVTTYGQTTADTESARPGYSEHQTGWAVDIASPSCIEDCFGTTPAATWLLANAARYGFIQRYQVGKSEVTGYRNEPWHFRYVGTQLAAEIQKSNQVLEEFFNLPPAPNY